MRRADRHTGDGFVELPFNGSRNNTNPNTPTGRDTFQKKAYKNQAANQVSMTFYQ
jgi:hypothetical protein